MKLEGKYTFDAPQDVVWDSLLDPDVLARVLPGCEKLEQIDENVFQGTMKIRVGPVQGKFQGKVTLTDINAPTQYRIIIDGRGAPGFVKGEGLVDLEAQNGATVMSYSGQGQVGGRIAGVGQRLLDSSAKALTRQSLDGLNRQIQARLQAQSAPPDSGNGDSAQPVPPPPPAEAPSEMEFALGVAKNMVEDLVPPERRPLLIGAGLGIMALLLFLNWWANVIARRTAREIWERR